MIELVLTIALLGILSYYAAPKFFNRTGFEERGYYEELVAVARYGQKMAIASNCSVMLTVTTAGYSLSRKSAFCDSGAHATAVNKPQGGGSLTGVTPTGVAVSAATLTFNADGSATPSSNTTVTVGPYSMVVNGATGFVETP